MDSPPTQEVTQNQTSFQDKQKQAKWAAASGFFGALAEYYDFALYGPAAALLFGPLFFEPLGSTGALMASLASFGVAYLVRPIGALIFGTLGDNKGRKPVLMMTLALMGVATFCIGLLPTYAQVGFIAPVLLVLLRVCQGLAAGVEQSGSGTLSAEHAPKKKRGFYTSWTMIGVSIGWFLGPTVMSFIAKDELFLMNYGWRIPFLLALPIVLLALWVRSQVTEPSAQQKEFREGEKPTLPPLRDKELFAEDDPAKSSLSKAPPAPDPRPQPRYSPLVRILKYHMHNLVRVFFCSLHMLVGVTCNVFVIGYAVNHQNMDKAAMLGALSIAGLSTSFLQPLFASLSDKIGRKPVFIASCLGLAATFPLVMLSLHSKSFWLVVIALTSFYVIVMAGNVVQASFYPELFPPEVRFTGVSVGTQLGLVVVGFSPIIYEAISTNSTFGWWPGAVFAGLCWIAAALSAATATQHA
ncbi:MAG: MFS transporter [Actinomycetaceae bacterium]|nr:MFS transporter [Actinomycetaceae bacterium]